VSGPGTALITGATSGIGAAFAQQLAAAGYDLVLVARDEARLAATASELASAYGREVTTLAADLSTSDGCATVAQRVSAGVDLLVNNAGMSLNRSFLRSPVEDEQRLLALNVGAVMRLTHAALPGMVERGHGAVVNVSSVSSFAAVMPGSTYPASKAWVTSFSEAMALAVRRHGVRVMALCPGYTRTQFHSRAGIDMAKTPHWLWLSADQVVRVALRDLDRGKLVSVPDWKYKAAAFGMRHAPRRLFHRVARDTRGQR
jgi:short-subunit dehydrogenase